MCGACAGERRKFDSIGVGITGALRLWPVSPRRPRMCGACVGERHKFDSIGVGLLDADAKHGSDEPLKPMSLPTRTRLSLGSSHREGI